MSCAWTPRRKVKGGMRVAEVEQVRCDMANGVDLVRQSRVTCSRMAMREADVVVGRYAPESRWWIGRVGELMRRYSFM